MGMQVINRLAISAYGMHIADQLALVSVPLVAALVFEATPELIGILVACQSMAHLLGSLPFGVMIDRAQSKNLVVAATMIPVLGSAGAAVSIHMENVLWFGLCVTFSGFRYCPIRSG
jgi:MFS family permease